MKPWKKLIALILFIIVLPVYAAAADLGQLRLSYIDGDVQINTEDTGEWVPVSVNMPLRDGDRLWVPEGARAEIQARNGSAVRLDENTSFDILTADRDSLQFYMGLGRAYLNFRSHRNSIIQMDTPVSSVRVYDRAKFNIDVSRDGDTDISVFRGRAYAESRNGKTQVGAGKMLSLTDDYADLSPLGRPDEWEEWNRERDRIFEQRGYSSQYLPDELDVYSGDLDSNGRWVYTSLYGYVWTPTMYISAGWSPYRNGRWVWMGGDYVWIAFEPWGWVPYHYGRWSFIASFGWCWVPPVRGDVYWGPGYVGWVYTPTYVSWVPLAPREVYYGYGNYGRHSVNIVNVNINKVVVKEVYKNVYVNNAVTVVPKESFLRGTKTDFKVRENPFLKERIHAGRPVIQPEKATRMPVIRETPKAKEPPGLVREIKVRELKEKRRFVRERDRSVFKPEAAPATMPVRSKKVPKIGGAIRPLEQKAIPGSQRIEQPEAEQPGKALPGRLKELRQVPEEKKIKQPQDKPILQPEIQRKLRQPKQPQRLQEKPSLKEEGKTDKNLKEITPPAKRQSIHEPPAEKKAVRSGEPTAPQPAKERKYRQTGPPEIVEEVQTRQDKERTGKKQRETGPVMLKKPSQQPDSRALPETRTKKEKEIRLKKSKTEEEESQEYKIPEEQADRWKKKK